MDDDAELEVHASAAQNLLPSPSKVDSDTVNNRPPLLVIDDLGKEKPSTWSLTKLYEIINRRYEELLPTVITSNYTPEELQELFQKAVPDNDLQVNAIIDRILESSHVIAMSGESYRLKNK